MRLEDELEMFHGTTRYYKNFTGLLFTDGIKYLGDRAGCYWLIDLVGSYQPELEGVLFQLWELEVVEKFAAVVTMKEDDNAPVLAAEHSLYGFPHREILFLLR
jgi:hypothetical protein